MHEETAYSDWLYQPLVMMENIYFNINLNAPDELILQEFKDQLAQARKKHQIKSRKRFFTQKDIEHWCDYGVLPFCDLISWARYAQITIPHRVIADALFKHGDKGEESIRRTTIPLTNTLLSSQTHHQLTLQYRV